MAAINTGELPATEDFLAQRIEELRSKEGWSFGELSQRMADAGCPIERSSLQKIERGKPRRKITVNELVAFSMVFNVEVDDLLASPRHNTEEMFLRDLEEGPRLAAETVNANTRLRTLVKRVADACLDPEHGQTRERRLREALEATKFDDPNKQRFLDMDMSKEEDDEEG